MMGQFVLVMRIVLLVAMTIIFVVALIIINNTMVMATLDRSAEIGTMRAIGAQKRQVVALFLAETLLLGLVAGGLGAGAGAALIHWLGQVGVPAVTQALVLFFAGPRLYPTLGPSDLLFGLGSVVSVSLLSAAYPALLAAKVPPILAMQARE
jgi:ABC-type antimicrobial peptide transport system permease subunit